MSASDQPVTVCITYDLADGITREEFRRWSSEIDQPTVLKLPGINRYDIFEVDRVEEGGPMPDIIDVIEAESLDAWLAADGHPSMTEIVSDFFERICKEGSIRTYYTTKIEPQADVASE